MIIIILVWMIISITISSAILDYQKKPTKPKEKQTESASKSETPIELSNLKNDILTTNTAKKIY